VFSGNLNTLNPGSSFDLSLSFQFRLPDVTQSDFRLSNLILQFGWDVVPGFSVSGSISYSRSVFGGFFLDNINLNPLSFTAAFASEGSSKPDVFFSVLLKGTYVFSDDPKFNGIPEFTGTGTTYRTTWRPVFVLTFDLCCYTLKFTFDSTPQAGASFTFSFVLPFGGEQKAIVSDADGIRFPLLPFGQPSK
jgi:hypothetical protein